MVFVLVLVVVLLIVVIVLVVVMVVSTLGDARPPSIASEIPLARTPRPHNGLMVGEEGRRGEERKEGMERRGEGRERRE